MLSRVTLVLSLLAVALCCLPLHATTYYVSQSTGDDSWPGTEAQPWKTLWRASYTGQYPDGTARVYQPGDRILLKRGDVWSDEADPGRCELVLAGNADVRKESWITVGAYGGDPRWERPLITHPSKDSTPDLINWSAVIDWAKEHPGTGFDQYLDRTYIRIAIRLDGYGWKIENLEISNAEMGITNLLLAKSAGGDGYWFEDIYLHDMKGLAWPKHPDPTQAFGCNPYVFGAIHMGWRNSNITIRDCAIVNNYDPLFLGGDGIYGCYNDSLIENVYMDKIYGGGLAACMGSNLTIRNCTILNAQYGEDAEGNRKGCWYGPDAIDPSNATNYLLDSCEVGFLDIGYPGADQSAVCINAGNVNATVRDCFIHDCALEAMTFNIDFPKNLRTKIENNVFYNNGTATYYPEYTPASLGGDCVPYPLESYSGQGDVTFTDNRVYKRPGQPLHLHPHGYPDPDYPPLHYDDYSYYEAHAPYHWSGRNNQIFTEYDNYIPPPPATTKTNIALPGCPGFGVWVSSNPEDAYKLTDGDYTTYWSPDPGDPMPCISLGWTSPQQIDTIRLFDRPDLYNCARAGVLDFDDGTWMNVTGGIRDNGGMREVVFDAAKNVTWLNFAPDMTRAEGTPGLSEIQVFLGSGPASPPAPPPGDGKCDFDAPTAPAALAGYYDSIHWGDADWATTTGGYKGTSCAYINFPPVVYNGPPASTLPFQAAPRTFTLPPDSKLKNIRVKAPAGAMVCINQNGAGQLSIRDGDDTWKKYSPRWKTSTTDIVNVTVCTRGVADDEYGVTTVFLDDIEYGE